MSEDRMTDAESLAATTGIDPRGEPVNWELQGDRTETGQGSETASVLAVEVVDRTPVGTVPPPPPPNVTPTQDPPHLLYVHIPPQPNSQLLATPTQEPNPLLLGTPTTQQNPAQLTYVQDSQLLGTPTQQPNSQLLGTPTTQEPNSQLLVYVQQIPPPPPPPPTQDSPDEITQRTFAFDAEVRGGSIDRFMDFDARGDGFFLDDAVVRYLDPRSLERSGVGDPVIPAVGDPVITTVGDPVAPAKDVLHFHAGSEAGHFHAGSEAGRFVIGEGLRLSAEGYFII